MCKNCHETSSGSVALSLAMTNPELVWAYNQEQKRASCQASKAQQSQIQQQQSQADIMSSSASTFSGSTAYSYDKGLDKTDTKQKRSVKQRIKEAFKDLGSPPTAYHDRVNGRKTEEPTPEYGPMSSTPQSRIVAFRLIGIFGFRILSTRYDTNGFGTAANWFLGSAQ